MCQFPADRWHIPHTMGKSIRKQRPGSLVLTGLQASGTAHRGKRGQGGLRIELIIYPALLGAQHSIKCHLGKGRNRSFCCQGDQNPVGESHTPVGRKDNKQSGDEVVSHRQHQGLRAQGTQRGARRLHKSSGRELKKGTWMFLNNDHQTPQLSTLLYLWWFE